MATAKKLLFICITFGVLLALVEIVSYAGAKILQSKRGMWSVPVEPKNRKDFISYDEYFKRRDPVVGWPFPEEFGNKLDINGSQHNPFFPNGGKRNKPCVSLYGDSFTKGGDTTSLAHNWGNLLSKQLGCYVANFGVGGYGTDQAYLRFVENSNDPAPVSLFGFHTGDTLRNLTRIRDLQNNSKWYALKPRYILDKNNNLVLIPIPQLNEDEYLRAIGERTPIFRLDHENLQPDGPAGVIKLEFPYTISLVRNIFNFYGLRARLAHAPDWQQFLQPNHPLQGLEIVIALSREFFLLAHERGKRPLVLILPHPSDFKYFQEHGKWPYQPVVDGYISEDIPFADFGPHLLNIATKAKQPIKSYFGKTGHYNDEGNEILANFVYTLLLENGLIKANKIKQQVSE